MDSPTLDGKSVRLEPLSLSHLPALEAIAFDPSIWRYMIFSVTTPRELRQWVDMALGEQERGTTQAWVTVKKGCNGSADAVVGATRFLDFDPRHRTVEIGNTWLTSEWRGTRVNTEAKLLQLTYAFETLDLQRVSFKTHIANQRSQAAIRAIGASYEGTFRNHYIMPDGSERDSIWFSIVRKEWPEVKDLLTRRINIPAC